MKKSILFAFSAVLLFCSCTSKYQKGLELLNDADRPTQIYYQTFANEQDDPLVFAKELLAGSYDSKIKEWYPKSGQVPIDEAFKKGWIRYGMTYDQIEEVIGSAGSVNRSNGVVEFAYYCDLRVQLCFENGRLYNWNDRR